MTILAASLHNVHASLDRYLRDQLVFADGAPVALRLHGVRRFVPPPELPWAEVHYDFLGLAGRFLNQAGPSMGGVRSQRVGTERAGYLQINLYQRARVFSQRYTTASIRDLVADAFPEGGIIPIADWATVAEIGGIPEQEASLIIDGLKEHVQDTGIQSGIIQHVVQIETRYWEIYTRA